MFIVRTAAVAFSLFYFANSFSSDWPCYRGPTQDGVIGE